MRLVFLGDLCLTDDALPLISEELNYLLKSADVVCVNLEGPIPPQSTLPALKAGPTVRQNEFIVPFINSMGVTHLCLANNHIMDYGREGLAHTLQVFKDFKVLGAGLSAESAYREQRIEFGTESISLLAFGEAQFGALDDSDLHGDDAGFAWVDSPLARQAVIKANQESTYVIVQVHAGLEMVEFPLPEWRARYRELVDMGADIVIGHHPHVLQGAEKYKGGMIYYSLGNFYMDFLLDTDPENEQCSGGALEVLFDSSKSENVSSRLIPLKSTRREILIDFEQPTQAKYDALCADLSCESEYMERVSETCEKFWSEIYCKYYESALMGLGTSPSFSSLRALTRRVASKIVKKREISGLNETMLIHNLRIETHRWVVQRALLKRMYEKRGVS